MNHIRTDTLNGHISKIERFVWPEVYIELDAGEENEKWRWTLPTSPVRWCPQRTPNLKQNIENELPVSQEMEKPSLRWDYPRLIVQQKIAFRCLLLYNDGHG